MSLNFRSALLFDAMLASVADLHAAIVDLAGSRVIDLGITTRGGLNAGLRLAELCMAGLGNVSIVPGRADLWEGPAVAVGTDHPLVACMAAQYAGWQLSHEKFFALGSGAMRAAGSKERLIDELECREQPGRVVGALETRKLPPDEIVQQIATACRVAPCDVSLVVAPTASQAGNLQIVARSVETALHKLHELGFDLRRVESGWGVAPLPPVAKDDLAGIGRTNDAILYGAEVTLWVRGDDELLAELGPRVPSSASKDYGQPFAAIFKQFNYNFYDIDPHLFSPACIALHNLDSGRVHRFGRLDPAIIRRSFTT